MPVELRVLVVIMATMATMAVIKLTVVSSEDRNTDKASHKIWKGRLPTYHRHR